MRAALLSNTGHYQMALQAIELSLELDPNNPETYSIKTSIMGQLAAMQSHSNSKKIRAHTPPARSGAASFFSGLGIQIVGLDRKSTRLNSSHSQISYAVFCLK